MWKEEEEEPEEGPEEEPEGGSRPGGRAGRALSTPRHLEFLLNASLALENEEDYRVWLAHYARHLSQESEAAKLQELCDELMGPGPVTAIPTGGARWLPPRVGGPPRARGGGGRGARGRGAGDARGAA